MNHILRAASHRSLQSFNTYFMLQTVTEWTIEPEAAHPLQPAPGIPEAVGQVQFGRAGPDMSPGTEELIEKAAKQTRYQQRRGFQLPEHDVSLVNHELPCAPMCIL